MTEQLPCVGLDAYIDTVKEAVGSGLRITVSGTGDSMMPFINDQTDQVILAPLPDRPLKSGDICLYQRKNGRCVIHRVYRVSRDTVSMLGDAQKWVERGVPRDQLIAFVPAIVRDGVICSCDSRRARGNACVRMRCRMLGYHGLHFLGRLASYVKKIGTILKP